MTRAALCLLGNKTANTNLLYAACFQPLPHRWQMEANLHFPQEKRGKHPRCLMSPSVLICTASATHNSMNSTSSAVKRECFYSFGNKSQQNNRQQFRLLVGLLTLLGAKAVFHNAMVSPVVDGWFHVSQRACVWASGTTKEENGLVRETFPLLLNRQKYLRPRLALPFSSHLAAAAVMPVK